MASGTGRAPRGKRLVDPSPFGRGRPGPSAPPEAITDRWPAVGTVFDLCPEDKRRNPDNAAGHHAQGA
jgi:hypothetical protein